MRFVLLLLLCMSYVHVVHMTACYLRDASSSYAIWYDPPGVCTNCYCKWLGFKDCYGGCDSQKIHYNIQHQSNNKAFAEPDLQNMHNCVAGGSRDISVTADCYDLSGNLVSALDDVTLNIKEPTSCSCDNLCNDLSSDDKTSITNTIHEFFDDATAIYVNG